MEHSDDQDALLFKDVEDTVRETRYLRPPDFIVNDRMNPGIVLNGVESILC